MPRRSPGELRERTREPRTFSAASLPPYEWDRLQALLDSRKPPALTTPRASTDRTPSLPGGNGGRSHQRRTSR